MQVQLASIHNKQIRLHDEGLRVISSFPQNIVILSIVGASRCGKYVHFFIFKNKIIYLFLQNF